MKIRNPFAQAMHEQGKKGGSMKDRRKRRSKDARKSWKNDGGW